ncbi:hypothetical protein [Mucilaginibacter sp.]|uniref:hypothetical protein n=1 Tax=Mucilaginibacter sp. TaxID=1882438 RepID=UPI003B005E46
MLIKTNYKIVFWLILLPIFILLSCRKSDVSTEKNINARIDSTGLCGFVVKINTSKTSYNAVNLPDLYKKDSLKIRLSYHLLNTKYQCISGTYLQIYIDAIHVQQ